MTLSAGALGANVRRRWTPLELGANLVAWYDGSDSSTVTLTSSKISQLNDKSGNANHVSQGTAANRPTILSANQNGLDVMSFASNGFLEGTLATGFTGTAASCFAVVKPGSNAASYARAVSIGKTTGNDYDNVNSFAPVLRISTFSQMGAYFYSAQYNVTNTTYGNWYLAGSIMDNTSLTTHFNGATASATISTPSLDIAKITIGTSLHAGTSTGNDKWNNPIAEVVLTKSALSTADRQRVEGYFAWKWALTGNLASDHPYKNIRP